MHQVYPTYNQLYPSQNKHQFCPQYTPQNRKNSFDTSTQNQSQNENDILLNNLNRYAIADTNTFDHKHYSNPQNSKYKIQLCRNYMNYGVCPYRQRCQYAHGRHQLRYTNITEMHQAIPNPQILTPNQKYKTKPCREFFKKGYCLYGQTCNYLHRKVQYCDNIYQKPIKKTFINLKGIEDEGFKQVIQSSKKSRLMTLIELNTIPSNSKQLYYQ